MLKTFKDACPPKRGENCLLSSHLLFSRANQQFDYLVPQNSGNACAAKSGNRPSFAICGGLHYKEVDVPGISPVT